ncbi:unnamed protein product [Chironomus riparius]|uniref:Lipase domain-containing protein n=1 Tax=Chironomus riparius TaxID=315576 RepID=A0A9N9WX60_9DIPT|nr:unnamed protein product [Chironomus riparius]
MKLLKLKLCYSPDMNTSYSINLGSMAEMVHFPNFNKSIPTIIYIRGFLGSGEFDNSVEELRSAYLLTKKENFVAVDWSAYSKIKIGIPYFDNIADLKTICEKTAEQLKKIQSYRNFYLIGHSLGAQCAGLVGRHLKKISNNEFIIPRIYALDPAGPHFRRDNGYFESVTKSDAAYVQVIHTNYGLYGLDRSTGHSDFYPNNGMKQPECLTNMCSHRFAWVVFQKTVIQEGLFTAQKCDSFNKFIGGD